MKKVHNSLSGLKGKRARTDFIAPTTKRGRQSTCGNWEETESGMSRSCAISRFGNKMSSCCSSFNESMENLPSQTGSYQDKLLSSISSINGRVEESVDCGPYDNVNAPGSSRGNESPLLIDLNLPQIFPELEYQIREQNDPRGSSRGNESPLLIDLNLPQASPELECQIPGKNDAPGSSCGNESPLLIYLNLPQSSLELEYQIPEQNDVPGSSRGNEYPLLIDLNLPQVSLELEYQIPERNDAPGSSHGNESPLLVDLNLPQVSSELENQIREQNDMPGSSRGNPLFIDLNEPQVFPELEYKIPERNDPRLPNSSAIEVELEQQDTDHTLLNSYVSEARREQQPIVNSGWCSTRRRPPVTRALEALAHGCLTAKPRRRS